MLKEDIVGYMESTRPKVADVLSGSEGEGSSGVRRKVLATPAVRRMAGEEGVNLVDVRGTGEGGRVLKEDLQRHLETRKTGIAEGVVCGLGVGSRRPEGVVCVG